MNTLSQETEELTDNTLNIIKNRSIGNTLNSSSHSFAIRSKHIRRESLETPEFNEKPTLRIYIVRHGHSLSNQDPKVLQICSDHTVPLSQEGIKQATKCGNFLKEQIDKNEIERIYSLWVSPYKRARETADIISNILGDRIEKKEESILLVEQQFGLFEGLPLSELSKKYPYEYSHFEKAIEYGGRFYAQMPLGESRFDVAVRLRGIIEEIKEAYNNNKITDAIIVTHGVTARTLAMLFLGNTPEWLEVEANPKNCSIRLLENKKDKGYILEGFSSKRKRLPPCSDTTNNDNEEPERKKQKISKFEAICSTQVHSSEDRSKLEQLLTTIQRLEDQINNLKAQAVETFEETLKGNI